MRTIALAAALLLAVGYSSAEAVTCTIAGVTRTCDWICGSAGSGLSACGNPTTLSGCDDAPFGNADGVCTICGNTTGSTLDNDITGTPAGDFICAKNGDDVVHGGGGDDWILGGGNNDQIFGEDGDDYIDGEGGDDIIDGGAGGNYILGGTGDDDIAATGTATVDPLGNVLCGEAGNDTLAIDGSWGHSCFDAGSGQGTSGGADCLYDAPASPGVHEVGTATNCRGTSGTGTFSTLTRDCGCP